MTERMTGQNDHITSALVAEVMMNKVDCRPSRRPTTSAELTTPPCWQVNSGLLSLIIIVTSSKSLNTGTVSDHHRYQLEITQNWYCLWSSSLPARNHSTLAPSLIIIVTSSKSFKTGTVSDHHRYQLEVTQHWHFLHSPASSSSSLSFSDVSSSRIQITSHKRQDKWTSENIKHHCISVETTASSCLRTSCPQMSASPTVLPRNAIHTRGHTILSDRLTTCRSCHVRVFCRSE